LAVLPKSIGLYVFAVLERVGRFLIVSKEETREPVRRMTGEVGESVELGLFSFPLGVLVWASMSMGGGFTRERVIVVSRGMSEKSTVLVAMVVVADVKQKGSSN